MPNKKTNYTRYLEKRLSTPRNIAGLLNAVLLEEDKRVFLLTMRDVIKANGGFTDLSRKTGISREHLYYTFSNKGNPSFKTINKVLKTYNVQLGINPIHKKAA
jgi:probable addiction module antidote protein